MIEISDKEFENFLSRCIVKKFKRYEVVSRPNIVPNEIFFVNKGLIRVIVTDKDGTEHSLHFALENQFIADYSAFMLKQPSLYTLQTEEETETVVMPRAAIEWGYKNLNQGDKLGRLIAEFYFVYQDNRLKNLYTRTPKERYDTITEVFPNIHDRVPQHMIASYLGITPIHLSRLKKASIKKI
ncbi:Crp/Fnr family transcriptional regulator [Asinibacterium sp. OR53]|uniref:Crp/Fnr family transcriptional regulator n=1 Tax=Asinibacterium sp. OR53 TaxID=925409 RepID=UPI0004B63696|nr:Crp/Fnr family transcriptional regulator [Asinibacterium sp. OR53]